MGRPNFFLFLKFDEQTQIAEIYWPNWSENGTIKMNVKWNETCSEVERTERTHDIFEEISLRNKVMPQLVIFYKIFLEVWVKIIFDASRKFTNTAREYNSL